MKRQIEKLS
jgi:archaellum component FlaC